MPKRPNWLCWAATVIAAVAGGGDIALGCAPGTSRDMNLDGVVDTETRTI